MTPENPDVFEQDGVKYVGPNYTLAQYEAETDAANFPVAMTLRFASDEKREEFIVGVNELMNEFCDIHTRWRSNPPDTRLDYNVAVWGDDEDDE